MVKILFILSHNEWPILTIRTIHIYCFDHIFLLINKNKYYYYIIKKISNFSWIRLDDHFWIRTIA
jgi:hypothetical protein